MLALVLAMFLIINARASHNIYREFILHTDDGTGMLRCENLEYVTIIKQRIIEKLFIAGLC